MKVTIHSRLRGSKVVHVVPPAYRAAVVAIVEPHEEYSLLLFSHAPRDVVNSAPIRKAIRRLGSPAPGGAIAVGTVFTEEALALLAEIGAQVVAFRKAHWTDESANARQL